MVAQNVDLLVARSAHVAWWLGGARWYYGWTIVAVFLLTMAAALGTRSAYSVLLVPVADDSGWGRGLTAGAISLGALVGAMTAVPLGMLLDRWRARYFFAAAAVVTGLGLALAAASREPWQLYLCVGVLAGLGLTPLVPKSAGVVIANWFVRRRGLAGAMVSTGVGLGVLVIAPLTQWVVTLAGWQAGFLVLAALFLLGIAPLNAVAQRHRPEDCGLLPDGDRLAAGRPAAPGPSVRQALRSSRFWLLVVGQGLGSLPLHLLLVHGVAHLVDVGFSPTQAAAALGLSGAATAGAMLLWGYVADRWGGEWAYAAGSLALIASLGVLYVLGPGQETLLHVYALLFALGFGSRQGLTAFLVAALGQGRSLGALMGIAGALVSVGTAVGATLGGWAFDHTGSYHPAFVLAAVSAVAAAACVWAAAPRRGLLEVRA